MSFFSPAATYDELPVPSEALANGGAEMIRVGIVGDELFVTARRAFDDPSRWGELLAHVVRRLGMLYAAESDTTAEDVDATIATGFAATLGFSFSAPIGPSKRRFAAKSATTGARAKPTTKPTTKPSAKPRTKVPAKSKSSKPALRRKPARAKS